jgi:hypothetical protein
MQTCPKGYSAGIQENGGKTGTHPTHTCFAAALSHRLSAYNKRYPDKWLPHLGVFQAATKTAWTRFMWITREKLWINRANWGKLAILFEILIFGDPHIWGSPKALAEIFPEGVGWGFVQVLTSHCPQVGGDRIRLTIPRIFPVVGRSPHI